MNSPYQPKNRDRQSSNQKTENFGSNKSKVVEVDYFKKDTKEKILEPDLLAKKAEQQAMLFPEGKERLSKSQIRRFFGAIKSLHMQLESAKNWQQVLPLFKMFKSKVAYAERAGSKKIPREFAEFLRWHIDKVGDDEDNFKAFVLYFEAVLGFAYGLGKIGE